MGSVYRIKDWSSFEKSDHRKVKTITWVSTPTNLNSLGRLKIMAQPNGFEIMGVWEALVALAAGAPAEFRGMIVGSSGEPYSVEDMALKVHGSAEAIERCLPFLTRIGWLIEDKIDEDTADRDIGKDRETIRKLPDNIPEPPDDLPEPPEVSRNFPTTVQDTTVHDSTGEKDMSESTPPKAAKPIRDDTLAHDIAQAWNEAVSESPPSGCPPCQEKAGEPKFPKSLRKKLRERRNDPVFESDEEFVAAFRDRARRVCQSPFHRGANDSGWRASLAWLLEPGGWEKSIAVMTPDERKGAATARDRPGRVHPGFQALRDADAKIEAFNGDGQDTEMTNGSRIEFRHGA